MDSGARQNNGIRQLYSATPTDIHRFCGNITVNWEPFELRQKCFDKRPVLFGHASHYFHPGDQANRLFPMSANFLRSLWNAIQIIDQNIGIEKNFYHSDRIVS